MVCGVMAWAGPIGIDEGATWKHVRSSTASILLCRPSNCQSNTAPLVLLRVDNKVWQWIRFSIHHRFSQGVPMVDSSANAVSTACQFTRSASWDETKQNCLRREKEKEKGRGGDGRRER